MVKFQAYELQRGCIMFPSLPSPTVALVVQQALILLKNLAVQRKSLLFNESSTWMGEVSHPGLELYEIWPIFFLPIDDPILHQRLARNFVKRHVELNSKFSRKYDHKQALWRILKLNVGGFGLYEIPLRSMELCHDIYNFDETGFQMGVGPAGVVTGIERARNSNLVQPGDREWVTVIAWVNATGWTLRTMSFSRGRCISPVAMRQKGCQVTG